MTTAIVSHNSAMSAKAMSIGVGGKARRVHLRSHLF
jgi:hypothetical protein